MEMVVKRLNRIVLLAATIMSGSVQAESPADGVAKPIHVDAGEGCVFNMKTPERAKLTSSQVVSPATAQYGGADIEVGNPRQLATVNYIPPFHLTMSCTDQDADIVTGQAARFDKTSGKWVRDLENRLKHEDWDDADKDKLDKATNFYSLVDGNAEGYAITEDNIFSGEERSRLRKLTFCLVYPP